MKSSFASGAAIAVGEGIADETTEDVTDGVAETIADVIGVGVADVVAVVDSRAMFVEFDGSNVESGKKIDTSGMIFEGSMLMDCSGGLCHDRMRWNCYPVVF